MIKVDSVATYSSHLSSRSLLRKFRLLLLAFQEPVNLGTPSLNLWPKTAPSKRSPPFTGDCPPDYCDSDGHAATSSSELVLSGYCAQTHDKLYGFDLNIYDMHGLHHRSKDDSHGGSYRKPVRHQDYSDCHAFAAGVRHHVGAVHYAEGGHLAG